MSSPSTGPGDQSAGEQSTRARGGTETRSRAIAFVVMGLASLVGLILAGQAWWRFPGAEVTLSGNEATGSLAGLLSGAALAGVALALLLRVFGRRILAFALVALGIAMTITGIPRSAPRPTDFPQKFQLVLDATQIGPGRATALAWAYAVCGLVLVVGGVLMLVRAGRWPRPVDRFTRRHERAAETTVEDDPHEVWRAMDAGHDPTESAGPDDSGTTHRRE